MVVQFANLYTDSNNSMKNLVVLYAGNTGDYAKKNILNENALSRSINWAKQISDVCSIKTIDKKQSLQEILTQMLTFLKNEQAETVIFAHAECPFYSSTITEKLLVTHKKYAAEYTFADGFPYGIAPEILNIGTVKFLNNLVKDKPKFCDVPISKNGIFELMQTDINSFEIETVLSKKDYRSLRLDFSCDTKRNFLTCKNLAETMMAKESTSQDSSFNAASCNPYSLCDMASSTTTVLRTVPAYYEIQIVKGWKRPTIYDPSDLVFAPNNTMQFENFEKIIDKIFAFSHDAVISLSLYGDPLLHESVLKMVEKVLEYDSLSLLIETDGTSITEKLISEIATTVANSKKRTNNQVPINWIVRIDSIDALMYSKIHQCELNTEGEMLFKQTLDSILCLKHYFPDSVYPQFVRMNENEEQLEKFYRYWKDISDGKFIIQKYDSIAGLLKDRRVANLEPLIRNPCWHLRRDLCILIDGEVPICRESAFVIKSNKTDTVKCGNIFYDSLETIFNNGLLMFQSHLDKKYCTQCKACDEYYTFNF